MFPYSEHFLFRQQCVRSWSQMCSTTHDHLGGIDIQNDNDLFSKLGLLWNSPLCFDDNWLLYKWTGCVCDCLWGAGFNLRTEEPQGGLKPTSQWASSFCSVCWWGNWLRVTMIWLCEIKNSFPLQKKKHVSLVPGLLRVFFKLAF